MDKALKFAEKYIADEVTAYYYPNLRKQADQINSILYFYMKRFGIKKLVKLGAVYGACDYATAEAPPEKGIICFGNRHGRSLNSKLRQRHALCQDPKKRRIIRQQLRSRLRGEYNCYTEHSMLVFPNEFIGVILHELGHVFVFQKHKQIAKFLGIEDCCRDLCKLDIEKYAVTERSKDDTTECLAENFTLYVAGYREKMHPKMKKMFQHFERK